MQTIVPTGLGSLSHGWEELAGTENDRKVGWGLTRTEAHGSMSTDKKLPSNLRFVRSGIFLC
jgi:hypothetical protein